MTFPRRHARRCRRLCGSGSIPFRERASRNWAEDEARTFVWRVRADDARRRKHGGRAAVAARGCGGSAAEASHGFVARVGIARANGLDLWADRVSVAAFDFAPGSCMLKLASSDDLADAVGDQLARARSVAVRSAAA